MGNKESVNKVDMLRKVIVVTYHINFNFQTIRDVSEEKENRKRIFTPKRAGYCQ